jgi:hypothetical protein
MNFFDDEKRVKRNIETTTQKFFDDLKDNFEEIYKLKRN